MSSDTVRTDVLGHESSVQYSTTWAGYALVGMRVAIGWVFFDAGVNRLTDPTWSAGDVLLATRPENPLSGLWLGLGHAAPGLVGAILAWGLALVGIALLFGAAVRLSALLGGGLMVLLWAVSLPIDNALFVDEHVVYLLVLFALGAFGAGRIAGLDAYFEGSEWVRERPWLRSLLG
ncbi:MAG: DoxX family protein [Halanaeroarchaeum sp.]